MRLLSISIFFSLIPAGLFAQQDLMDLLNDSTTKEINYSTATFKSTRIMTGQSIERMAPGQLDVRISHRFGPINSGIYDFYGLDKLTNIHLGLEYGILKWLMVGVGRGSFEKTYDGFAKFTILRQSTGARIMPVSVSAFSSIAVNSMKWTDPDADWAEPDGDNYFSSRLYYATQVLVARKFSPALSLQLTPSYVHRNQVKTELDPNDLFAVGAGGRLKLSKRISFNAEYYYVANKNPYSSPKYYNPFTVGFDIETGGHVFQLMFTNSYGIIEKAFIGETDGQWKTGDIHFGFNISRVFTLKKHKAPTLVN
jgi:hypothetical protein